MNYLLRAALEDDRLVQSFSGVRTVFGLGPDVSPELEVLTWAYAYCYAAELIHQEEITLLLGRDPRPTGERIAEALARGFVAGSIKGGYRLTIIDLGTITTPLVQTAVRALGAHGGVIITASHNPITDNGFKFLTGCGPSPNGSAPPGALLSGTAMTRVINAVARLAKGDGVLWQEHMEAATQEAVEASLRA
jgi:phosphomannomutase